MSMRARWFVSLALLAACSGKSVPRETEPPSKTWDEAREARPKPPPAAEPAKKAPETAGLPAGFRVEGTPEVRTPFLGPGAMWRFLVSRLTTLRADARAGGEDILVTFEPEAVHVTLRSGARRTWRLPTGLRLEGGPRHVLLGSDLTTTVYAADGAQTPPAEEITVIRARVEEADGKGVFRLAIKGGRGFQSISNHG
jgi:hypothetical protein